MELNFLANDFVDATEKAAIACCDHIGRNNKEAADAAAVRALRDALNAIPMRGRIVIGEGERDEAPMLFIGEEVGEKNQVNLLAVDIAIDPLEGTTLTAKGHNDALCVMACAPRGGLLFAPDVYMDKIAIGRVLDKKTNMQIKDIVDLDVSVKENLRNLAKAKSKDIKDITICILERERHNYIIEDALSIGAKICLIGDGDVAATIRASLKSDPIDIYIGQGGAPEGVLSAAALRCLGGQMQARLYFRNEDEKARAKKTGITDLQRKYNLDDLCGDEVIFCATGVTNGALVSGVRKEPKAILTETLYLNSELNGYRLINSYHNNAV